MSGDIREALKGLTENDLKVDALGRLIIDKPEVANQVAAMVPSVRRIAGADASNNCNCGGGGGGSGCEHAQSVFRASEDE